MVIFDFISNIFTLPSPPRAPLEPYTRIPFRPHFENAYLRIGEPPESEDELRRLTPQVQSASPSRSNSLSCTWSLERPHSLERTWSLENPVSPARPPTPSSALSNIEPINRWRHGDRTLRKPRRLDDTPTKGHYDHDLTRARTPVRGSKRCPSCGTILRRKERDAEGAEMEVGDLEEVRKVVERVREGRVGKGRVGKGTAEGKAKAKKTAVKKGKGKKR